MCNGTLCRAGWVESAELALSAVLVGTYASGTLGNHYLVGGKKVHSAPADMRETQEPCQVVGAIPKKRATMVARGLSALVAMTYATAPYPGTVLAIGPIPPSHNGTRAYTGSLQPSR